MEEPGFREWLLLLTVGAIGGLIRALKKAERCSLLSSAMEGVTVIYITLTVYLMSRSLLAVQKIYIPDYGLIAAAGLVAHFGIRDSIRLAAKIMDILTKR